MPVLRREILDAVSRELQARDRYRSEIGCGLERVMNGCECEACREARHARAYFQKVEEWEKDAREALNGAILERINERLRVRQRDLYIVAAVLGESVEVNYGAPMP